MAVMEQLIYGYHESADMPGRGILARSAGVDRDCAAELVRLCEGWGGLHPSGTFPPCLLSLPLKTRLPSLAGRLFAVIRVADSNVCAPSRPDAQGSEPELAPLDTVLSGRVLEVPAPLFHAVLLTEADYIQFDLNPYALAQEGVFLDRWVPGLALERRELRPTSLAPLISPLPTDRDVMLIEDALRQIFVHRKLLLPLQAADPDSDRFLALLIAALPLGQKRDLKFASFAMTANNDYNLAAVYHSDSYFRGWQRLFMASATDPLPAQLEEYLESVRDSLSLGDLLGLEQISRRGVVLDLALSDGRRAPRAAITTASIVRHNEPAPAPNPWFKMPGPAAVSSIPRMARPARSATVRRSSPPWGGQIGLGWFASFVAIVILIFALLYWLDQHAPYWLPWGRQPAPVAGAGSGLLGVIDVGHLYGEELGNCLSARDDGDRWAREKSKERALTSLRIGAAEDLGRQSRLFTELAAEGIQQPGRPDREAERLTALAQRGTVLEQEMHRLLLAYVAFETETLWQDLADLDGQRLAARYDSLRRCQPERMVAVARVLGLEGQVAQLSASRLQVASLAKLLSLLDARQRDAGWTSALEAAARTLAAYPLRGVNATYRQCAFHLARLKRAEDSDGFATQAFSQPVPERSPIPPDIAEILLSLRADVREFGTGEAPPLLVDTIDFYTTLQGMGDVLRSRSRQQIGPLLTNLASNQAVRFDPGTYSDHGNCLRIAALTALQAGDSVQVDLPDVFYPEGDRQTTVSYLALKNQSLPSERWREVAAAAPAPFFARWALAEAQRAELEALRLGHEFDRTYQRLARQSAELARRAASGADCTDLVFQLDAELPELCRRYAAYLADDPQRGSLLAHLDSLRIALARPWHLAISGVTVRLASDLLDAPGEVVVELTGPADTPLQLTAPIAMGPAAPAGSGWVGASPLAIDLAVGALDSLHLLVRKAGDQAALLAVTYDPAQGPSLPGALLRAQPGSRPGSQAGDAPAGSVAFQTAEPIWRQLQITPLPHPDL